MPAGQRDFRPDDGQADFVLLGELDEPRKIGRREIDIFALGFGARVAGSDKHPLDAAALGDFPGQRMFAPAVADHKHFHSRAERLLELRYGFVEKFGLQRGACPLFQRVAGSRKSPTARVRPSFGPEAMLSVSPAAVNSAPLVSLQCDQTPVVDKWKFGTMYSRHLAGQIVAQVIIAFLAWLP